MILQEDYKPLEDKFSETWPENVSWMHLAAECTFYLIDCRPHPLITPLENVIGFKQAKE